MKKLINEKIYKLMSPFRFERQKKVIKLRTKVPENDEIGKRASAGFWCSEYSSIRFYYYFNDINK